MTSKRKFEGIWIPAPLWLFKGLKPVEKVLLKEINSLDNGDDGCTARNKYFADLLGVSESYISKMINSFINKGYIERHLQYFKDSKQIQKRHIWVVSMPGGENELRSKEWVSMRINALNESQDPDTIVNHPVYQSVLPYLPECKNNSTVNNSTLLNIISKLVKIIKEKDNEIPIPEAPPEKLVQNLPPEELAIIQLVEKVKAYFDLWPAMVDKLKQGARIRPDDAGFDWDFEIERWVRNVADSAYIAGHIEKYIPKTSKGFAGWLQNYNQFKPKKSNKHGKTDNRKNPNLISTEDAIDIISELAEDD